ncbi:hypothetical protein F5144DRAFT_601567 [Chaetomium tenue]|uniref:Uncharacterized protein n=1 Tax=Chaetomium tenue TaxID=1854479 RepID=A0ACB7PFT2_9PEZI|nr:hypothetical protein F5144DRAFT_601567 [Chaetomium globosum]
MADNNPNNPQNTSSWFRTFSRSSSNTTKQQPPPSQPGSQPPQPPTLQTRHTFHHIPTPASSTTPSASPTTGSPPTRSHHPHHQHSQHHHHRKSAGATLRTVSSFLSLKSTSSSSANNRSGSGGGHGGGHGGGGGALEAMPASLSMLPLTEVDYHHHHHSGYSSYAGSEGGGSGGVRSRSGSGRGGNERGAGAGEPWHNPNLMQMAEMLSSVMGRMGAGERLDPTYHSCILSLIEGFYHLTRKLRDTEEKLAEIKDLRERELEQFRGMTEEWIETGEAYKAEVKRLELALAKESKDGVASVALARHGSLVDRIGSKRFHAKLKRLHDLQHQDTAKEEQALLEDEEEPVDLAEATSSYRTLSAIPRILDSDNDIALSRIVERREFEEVLARCKRREGRVRAAPVFVRPGGVPEPHDILKDTLRAQEDSKPTARQDVFTETAREHATADSAGQSSLTPSLESQSSLSTDNESSSSSDESPDTGVRPAQPYLSLFGKLKGGQKKGKKQSELSESSDQLRKDQRERKGKGVLPHLTITTSQSRHQETLLVQPTDKKERHRCYSFDKGGDEVLSVTSPLFPSEVDSPLEPSTNKIAPTPAETNRLFSVLGLRNAVPDSEGGVPAAPTSDSSSSSISHSTSTNTVKWVGEDDGGGDGTADGGSSDYGRREGSD